MIKVKFPIYREKFRSVVNEYSLVTHLWIGNIIISFVVAGAATYSSISTTREPVVKSLFIGVITLLTLSLGITTLGIQLTSNRYSHRVDYLLLQMVPVGLHFLPHLIAIAIGIFILLSIQIYGILFFAFIFSSIVAILSIFHSYYGY
jgi:hypothetical protein